MLENIIEGLMVSKFSDNGPEPIINLSKLDEITRQKLSIVGITILSMGFTTVDQRDERDYKLLGPIPVPDFMNSGVLSIFFNLEADLGTDDERTTKFGRTCNLWIIFQTKHREEIFSNYKSLEEITIKFLRKIEKESELTEELFKELLNEIHDFESKKEESITSEENIPIKISSELLNYGFYTINKEETVVPVDDLKKISDLDTLIQINLKDKVILVLKLNKDLSQRDMFIAGRAASQFNLEKLKSEFQIMKINDKIEVDFHLKKIRDLVGITS